jgi:drug/metabolite transporter (DMT)-like permease
MPIIEKINPALLETGTFSWLPLTVLVSGISAQTISFPVDAIIPILYGGLGSVGIAYTLQAVAQRDAPPAHATIILCFEGCFAAIGGALLLSEKVGPWTLLGFVLMLAGMLVTQWEVIAKNK